MNSTPIHLLPALRQYRHNDSPEFLMGYDYTEVNKVHKGLQDKIAELEKEKLHMQISMTCIRELLSVISAFVENVEPRSSEAVTTYNQCMEICHAIDEMDLPEFEFEELKEQE